MCLRQSAGFPGLHRRKGQGETCGFPRMKEGERRYTPRHPAARSVPQRGGGWGAHGLPNSFASGKRINSDPFSAGRVPAENTLAPWARSPVTASGSPQKRSFCGGRRNKRSGVRFRRRRKRIKRSLFRRGGGGPPDGACSPWKAVTHAPLRTSSGRPVP